MQLREVPVGGAATFWNMGEWTTRSTLLEKLEAESLGKFCPEPRTNSACLRDAVTAVYAEGKEHHVRKVKPDGFAIYSTQPGEYKVDYAHIITAKIDPAARISFHDEAGGAKYCEQSDAIVSQYNRHSGLIDSSAVAAAMVKILYHLGAVTLRPKGGFYWLPDCRLDKWGAVGKAVEESTAGSSHAVYMLRNIMDGDALRAVSDAVKADVLAEAERIEDDIAKSELGDRALDTRKEQASRLREKVMEYESFLGVSLKDLAEVCDRAEQAAVMAALMASTTAA